MGYTFRDEIGGVAGRVMAELHPGAAVVDAKTGNVTIRRALGGTFHVDATINGTRVKLIFDTGASAVVLTPQDAHAAGIRAFVTDQGALDTSLLGMSFLETLSSYSVSQNALEMRN